jgi:hypothetical protein
MQRHRIYDDVLVEHLQTVVPGRMFLSQLQ